MNSALPQKAQKILEQVIQMVLQPAIKAAGPVLVTIKRAEGDNTPDKQAIFIGEFKQGVAALFRQLLEKPSEKDAGNAKKTSNSQEDMEERISKYSLMDTDLLEAQLIAERLCASLEQEHHFQIDCVAMRIEKFCGLTFERAMNPLLAKHLTMVFRKACDELQATKHSSDAAMDNWGKMLKEAYPQWLEQLNGTLIKLHVLPRLSADDINLRYQKKNQEKAREMRKNLIAEITGKPQEEGAEVGDDELMRSLKALVADAAKTRPDLDKHLVSGSANGPAASKEEILDTLRQISNSSSVNEETGYRELAGDEKTLAEKIRTSTNIQSKALDDQTQNAISLLSMMFDKLQQEEQIADPIKPLINELQVPILKLAVNNQSFFSSPDNSAQELLNEIAKAGAHWTPKQNVSKDPFYKKISSIVQEISEASESSEENEYIFDEKLHTFKEFIEKEERRSSILEDRIIQAESVAARTQSARVTAEKIINRKIFRYNAQKHTADFLQNYWAQVLFFYINRDDEYNSPEQTLVVELIDALLVVNPENIDSNIDAVFEKILLQLNNLSLDIPDQHQVFENIRSEINILKNNARAELEAVEAARAKAAAQEAAEKAAAAEEAARLQAAAEKAAAEELAAQQEAARRKAAAEKAAAEQAAAQEAAARQKAAAEKAAAEQEAARAKAAAEQAAAEELAAQQEAARLKAAAEKAAAEELAAKKAAAEQEAARIQAAAEKVAAEKAAREAQELADSLAEIAAIEENEEDTEIEDEFDKKADMLRAESWFRLTNENFDNAKVKLAAIIKHNGNYIFVNREGVKVITTQKPGVASMLRNSELMIIDDAVFFDRALESVIHSLRR